LPSHRFARPLGLALTLICVLYFLQSLVAVDLGHVLALPVDGLLVALALSIIVYTALLVGVATGFAHLVQATGHRAATASEGLVVWGQANLAKYLPGNVLHFAGRQVLGARHGWPHGKIAAASLLEIGLFVLIPASLAGSALAVTGKLQQIGPAGWLGLAAAAAASGLALAFFGARSTGWLPSPAARLLGRLELSQPAPMLPALLYFLLFFIGMSLMCWWLYGLVTGTAALADLPLLAGAFLASWLLGFVIPGAPGGIGVREGTFALFGGALLGDAVLGQESLVIVALLMRLVALAGVGVLFLLALGVARELQTSPLVPPSGRSGLSVDHSRPAAGHSGAAG
jgi:glycosyltransferase 2 family protein